MDADTAEHRQRRAAVRAERFRVPAGGTRLIAVGALGAAVVAPTFNNAQRFSLLLAAVGG